MKTNKSFLIGLIMFVLLAGCGGYGYGGYQSNIGYPTAASAPMPPMAPPAQAYGPGYYGGYQPSMYAGGMPPMSGPVVLPSGGYPSPYGGSMHAGTGFDPRMADAVVAQDRAREAAAHGPVIVPATPSGSNAGSASVPSPSNGSYATSADLEAMAGQVTAQNQRLVTVEHHVGIHPDAAH